MERNAGEHSEGSNTIMVNTTNTGGTSTDNIIELTIPNAQGSDREPDSDVTNAQLQQSS